MIILEHTLLYAAISLEPFAAILMTFAAVLVKFAAINMEFIITVS